MRRSINDSVDADRAIPPPNLRRRSMLNLRELVASRGKDGGRHNPRGSKPTRRPDVGLAELGAFVAVALVSLALLLVTSFFAEPVSARSTGIINRSGNPDAGGAATCASCHSENQPQPTIMIDAPTSVLPGETVSVSVTVSGGPAVVAGFNASVSGLVGQLAAQGTDTYVNASQITHRSPKPFNEGSATFGFNWTAPTEPGSVTLYAAGISANNSGTTSGDSTGTGQKVITVASPMASGDVDCSGTFNIADALVIAQYSAGERTDGGMCPLPDPANELVVANGDVNADQTVNVADALLIVQCATGLTNEFCS